LAGWASVASALCAQPAAGARRIGFLTLSSDSGPSMRWYEAFRQGLRQAGYVDGESVVIERRLAVGRVDQLPLLAAELLRLQVEVIVTAPAGSAFFAKQQTSTVPIVFIGEPDPVGTGLVASLARPGGNVTGLADAHSDLVPKRLELLRLAAPAATRFAILWNPGNPSTAPQLKAAQAAARALGVTMLPIGVAGPGSDDLARAFERLDKARPEALLVVGDAMLGKHRPRIAELALQRQLPASGAHAAWAESGLLMSYGTDFVDLFRRGGLLVGRVLRGATPASIPVEQPTLFELAINAATAKAIGLALGPSLLTRADRIIE
jgi:putative tryptophan/tyrosine transport system substrate-binding protein